MKIDVYDLTTSDLDLGIWERKFVKTIEVPDEMIRAVMKVRCFAAKELGLNPKYTRCFEAGDYVSLKGKYTKEAISRLLISEDAELSPEEFFAKYE